MKKILPILGIAGIVAFTGCENPDPEISLEESVKTEIDTVANQQTLYLKGLEVEPKETWFNAKLTGKDEGFVYIDTGEEGIVYVYSELLFENPAGEEVALVGEEDMFFVGHSYKIEFHRFAKETVLRSPDIHNIFFTTKQETVPYEDQPVSQEADGILVDYNRLKKDN